MSEKFEPTKEQFDAEMAEARKIITDDLFNKFYSGQRPGPSDPNPGGPKPPAKKEDGSGNVDGSTDPTEPKKSGLWWP